MASREYCDECALPVVDGGDVVRVESIGKVFHDRCFLCKHCRSPLGSSYRQFRTNVFCAQCDDRRCPTCEKVVEDGFSLNGSVFHAGCIKCEFCRDVLDPSQLHLEAEAKTGKQMPYCKVCFKEQLGRAAPEVTAAATTSRRPANSESDHGAGAVRTTEATTRVREIPVCPKCAKDTEGDEVVTDAAKRVWHAACFKCASCDDRIKGSFVSREDVVFCSTCAERKCRECRNVVRRGEPFVRHNGEVVHKACFACQHCGEKVDVSEFSESDDGRVECDQCAKGS